MRILVIGDVYPWPPRDGYRLRFASVVQALADCGEVDLFVAAFDGEVVLDGSHPCVTRYAAAVAPSTRRSGGKFLKTFFRRAPRRMAWRDWGPAASSLGAFVEAPYDVVWYSHADVYSMLGSPSFGPSIVDLDNLEDVVLERAVSAQKGHAILREGNQARFLDAIRSALVRALDRRDVKRWSSLQRTIALSANAVVVCSDLDARRLGRGTVEVIPNGYPNPGGARSLPAPSQQLVMVGRFTYEPNLAGALWFLQSVFPSLRKQLPDATIRFVGRFDDRLSSVATGEGVTVVGEVEDIETELRAARGVVVPLLSGSGTRIKILEAFAYGVPLVTTTIGCEGIDVVPGVHALVCDDPLEFATACQRILVDDALWTGLSEAGVELYLDRYSTDSTARLVKQLVKATVEGSAAP
jgi:glycosyltransferase involved in cell wall biosynthesis